MADKPIVHISKKEEIFYSDIAEALLKFCSKYGDGSGTIYIDDVRIELFPSNGEWHKMELYFKKVVE